MSTCGMCQLRERETVCVYVRVCVHICAAFALALAAHDVWNGLFLSSGPPYASLELSPSCVATGSREHAPQGPDLASLPSGLLFSTVSSIKFFTALLIFASTV